MTSHVFSAINVSPSAPPGVQALVEQVLGWIFWAGIAAVIAGLIAGGISLAISNERGMGGENFKKIGWVIIGGIIIVASSQIASALMGA